MQNAPARMAGLKSGPTLSGCMADTWTITAAEQGIRLDRFLAAGERLGSRGRAVAALERGKVFLNDEEVGPMQGGVSLGTGDRVRVWMDRPGSAARRIAREAGAEGAAPGALE